MVANGKSHYFYLAFCIKHSAIVENLASAGSAVCQSIQDHIIFDNDNLITALKQQFTLSYRL